MRKIWKLLIFRRAYAVLLCVGVMVLLEACSTKIPFEQTCLTCVQSQRINCKGDECPVTIMAGGNCIATFDETGEKINLNHILTEEQITPVAGIPITLAKIKGLYFVIGRDFKNLWMLTPAGNEAKVKDIPLPEAGLTLPPVFEISDGNLLMRGSKNEYSFVYDIENKKWITTIVKAGA